MFIRALCERKGCQFPRAKCFGSVWELVNHSSFASPLRITSEGVETPPINPGTEEILFKYSGKNSPLAYGINMGLPWCIVSYSMPISIQLVSESLTINCLGNLIWVNENLNTSVVAIPFCLSRCRWGVSLLIFL